MTIPKKMPVEHALTRSTVRILAGFVGAPPNSVGTGFFYKVENPTTRVAKVLILTNKHVVEGADVVQFMIPCATSVTELDDYFQPTDRIDREFTWPIKPHLYTHPDPNVDLCAIDVTVLAGAMLQDHKLRIMFLDVGWLPGADDRKMMRDIEQVLVVGYPQGIWDQHNNMPIARTGTTATHPLGRYQGNRNFLVDVAAYQGSSGSPVFAYEAPLFRNPDGNYTPGTKVNLLGVVWAVVEQTVTGDIRVEEVPSSFKHVPVVKASLNLAVALHADAIRELDEIIRATLPLAHFGPA